MPDAYVYAIDERAPLGSWTAARGGSSPWMITTICQYRGIRDICRLICRRLTDRQYDIRILRIVAHASPGGLQFGQNCTVSAIRENFGMIRRFWANNLARRQLHPDVCIEVHACDIAAGPAVGGLLQELANQAGVQVKAADIAQSVDNHWRFEGNVRTIAPQAGYSVGCLETRLYSSQPSQTSSVLRRPSVSSLSLRRPQGLAQNLNYAGAYIREDWFTRARIHRTLNLQNIPQCNCRPRSDPRHQDYQP